jgi:hypothetical protein
MRDTILTIFAVPGLLVAFGAITAAGLAACFFIGIIIAEAMHDIAEDWRELGRKIRARWFALPIGTRSVLAGAHCFFIHPWFVALGWWKLFGFPLDPRLWVAFFVHDLGYWGKPNMDGAEGETHPFLGARVMSWLFDRTDEPRSRHIASDGHRYYAFGRWGAFTLFHSRYLVASVNQSNADRHVLAPVAAPSRLCLADKYAIALTPAWLYLPAVTMTGEITEYLAKAHERTDATRSAHHGAYVSDDPATWYAALQAMLVLYIERQIVNIKAGRAIEWKVA